MKTFSVEITETLQKIENIDANDYTEAVDKIIDLYKNENIILSSEDYITTDINLYFDEEAIQMLDNTKFNEFLDKNVKSAVLNSSKEELIKFAFGNIENAINSFDIFSNE